MKANEFNIHNIKAKFDFKDSKSFLTFLEEHLKLKQEEKEEAQKLLDEIDYEFSGIEEIVNDKEFIKFIKSARNGTLKRLERANIGIKAIEEDIKILKNTTNN